VPWPIDIAEFHPYTGIRIATCLGFISLLPNIPPKVDEDSIYVSPLNLVEFSSAFPQESI
jgi:hypothetical protein